MAKSLSRSFKALNEHLFHSGIPATGEMQYNLVVPGVVEVADFKLGYDMNRFRVVTVMRCVDEAAATHVEGETRRVPSVSAVNRNGSFVMACTFMPPDTILEGRVTAAFMAFQGALRTTT